MRILSFEEEEEVFPQIYRRYVMIFVIKVIVFLFFFNLPSPFLSTFLSKKFAITFNLDNFLALNLEKLL